MQKLPAYFDELISILETYINRKIDPFTLQTYGEKWRFGPYVQALREYDGVLLIEAASNKFLEPELPEAGQQAMLFMGWRLYPEDYLPNYAQFIDQSSFSPLEIAVEMARALHFGYGVDETCTFEIAPKIEGVHFETELMEVTLG